MIYVSILLCDISIYSHIIFKLLPPFHHFSFISDHLIMFIFNLLWWKFLALPTSPSPLSFNFYQTSSAFSPTFNFNHSLLSNYIFCNCASFFCPHFYSYHSLICTLSYFLLFSMALYNIILFTLFQAAFISFPLMYTSHSFS